MNRFVVGIFPDQARAYEGARALRALHDEGSVTLFGTAVVERDASGELKLKQRQDPGPLGMGVGGLLGALVGVLGGPVGAAAGFVAGSLAGSVRDLAHLDVSDEFLESIKGELTPGSCAVIAEVEEEWTTPVDARLEALGGRILRERRAKFVDDLLEKQADIRRTEFDQRRTERDSAKAERMESRLMTQLDDEQRKLARTAEKARARLDQTKEELAAKLGALQEQTAKASPEVRDRVNRRIAEIKRDFAEREQKLAHAFELAQQAGQP